MLWIFLGVCLEAGAAPPVDTKMVLHDNVKLVSQRKLNHPQALMAYVRWHEDMCKGLGRPVVRFEESDLDKLFGEETTSYFSGDKRMTHARSWSVAWLSQEPGEDRRCDFSLQSAERIEVMTDEKNVLFQVNKKGGRTDVLNKSPATVQRAKQERALRLSQLAEPSSLWARRMSGERSNEKRVNSIPCVMTANGLNCLFAKMPYHLPTGKPLVIQSGLSAIAANPHCEDTQALSKSYRDLAVCALESREEAVDIQVDVAMPSDAFEIPKAARSYPIKYLN